MGMKKLNTCAFASSLPPLEYYLNKKTVNRQRAKIIPTCNNLKGSRSSFRNVAHAASSGDVARAHPGFRSNDAHPSTALPCRRTLHCVPRARLTGVSISGRWPWWASLTNCMLGKALYLWCVYQEDREAKWEQLSVQSVRRNTTFLFLLLRFQINWKAFENENITNTQSSQHFWKRMCSSFPPSVWLAIHRALQSIEKYSAQHTTCLPSHRSLEPIL